MDALFDEAIKETNTEKRVELYHEIQNLVNADKPWAQLVFEMVTAGTAKELKNFTVLPDGGFDFYSAEWKE